ncbi:MAG: hypothetical protein K8W52_05200 [Deltaproteobacteria bacterium]|nr:hypothetical protein [Deltaproteobacteria bacterium]
MTATELWDRDALDAFEPARIGFAGPRIGRLAMIAVQVDLDCRYGERNGAPLVEFSFAGDDDGHPCTGRGWATLDADGQLRGRLYLHDGDDSAFVAQRAPAAPRPAKKKRETR